jgi:hypothetical protein
MGLIEKIDPLYKKLEKKMFFEHGGLKKKEKDYLTKYVQRMEITFLLNSSTINIQPFVNKDYRYEGIMFITVDLKEECKDQHIPALAHVIQRTIPNPTLLLFAHHKSVKFNSCMKRVNKADSRKVVLSPSHFTPWLEKEELGSAQQDFLDKIHLSKVSFQNFYEFYKDINLAVEALSNTEITGTFIIEKDDEKREKQKEQIQKVKDLEERVAKLSKAIKKELQFNKKAEMNQSIHQLKKQIQTLKEGLFWKE